MMKFWVFHKYRRLVRRGQAEPITCRHCGEEMTIGVGDETEPVLRCYTCNSLVKPGMRLYNDMKRKVDEFFGKGWE